MNFGKLLAGLTNSLGAQAVTVFLEMEAGQLAHQSRDTIVRAFTIPGVELANFCAKTGANFAQQQAANAKFANDAADFLLGFAPHA